MPKRTVARRRPPPARGEQLKIRMYNVGFGDCFLLWLPTPDGARKILFDCGSIKKAKHSIDQIVQQIITDVTDPDGVARIDVVVGTHRHRDHVSGFDDPLWRNVEVKEVWMPWTEHPTDPQARVIRETQSKLAAALTQSFTKRLSTARAAERSGLQRFELLAFNALSNESAMTTLHDGFAGRPLRRFMPTKIASDATFTTDALPGVTVHILGPSRDKDVIRDMDPPAGHSYLQMLDNSDASDSAPEPFNEAWWVEPAGHERSHAHLIVSPQHRKVMQKAGAEMEQAVATSLDGAVNGTSLMLVLRIGDLHLLFPGDAQWGTWQAALRNPDSLALLKRTSFLKVGHHGSHNATPKDFVENVIGKDFWAMVSTALVKNWPEIPRGPLLTALSTRTKKLARSDAPDSGNSAFEFAADKLYIDTSIPIAK